MSARTQLNININPELLKILKKSALENNRRLVDLINEILTNYVNETKIDQTKKRSIQDELEQVKKRLSILENLNK
tara:strand:- start:161 stop:385 length:225 start_codon:yes stop_codon:yes gene_type:complete